MIARKVVIETATGKVLRHGFTDFANDKSLDSETEQILESGFIFRPDIDVWDWFWTGVTFIPQGERIYVEDAVPFFALYKHRVLVTPKVKKVPNTNVVARELKGDSIEGFEGEIVVLNEVGLEREIAVILKYAFEHSMVEKAAYIRMNYSVIPKGEEFADCPPGQRSIAALLTDIARAPDGFTHLENSQLVIPGEHLSAGDKILIEDLYRDSTRAEDTNHNLWLLNFDAVTRTETLEDDDMYMCDGEKTSGAIAQGNSETVVVDLDVVAPGVFSKKGILELVKVVATGGVAGTSTDFTVEIFEDVGETKLICKSTGHDSTAAPWYGKYACCTGIPFKNQDSPQAAKLYVKITNVTDSGTTTFDVCLRGKELK